MSALGETAWQLYQSSPPALIAVLTAVVVVGGRHIRRQLQALDDELERVTDQLQEHDLLLDHQDDRLQQVRGAQTRNRERINTLMQAKAAAKGFNPRGNEDDTAPADSVTDAADGGDDP